MGLMSTRETALQGCSRSGVICSPNNFGYEEPSGEGMMRITALANYDRWASQPGMEGWGYERCLPYFKRMENRLLGGDAWRGDDGPLQLETGPAQNPLFQAWLEAGPQAGYRRTDDVNGYRQEGFARFDRNVHRGWRWSAATAYLRPVRRRPNLIVHCRAFATRYPKVSIRVEWTSSCFDEMEPRSSVARLLLR